MKKIALTVLSLFLLVGLPQWSQAQSAAWHLFQRANQAYQEGQYQQAIELYEQIRQTGLTSGVVLYNLGNAYFKDNQLGRAILFYERARRSLPRDQDVTANLALAEGLTVDKIATEKGSLPGRALTWLARSASIAELTRGSFVLYLITAALIVAGILTQAVGLRKKILAFSIITGFLLVIAGTSLFGSIYQQRIVSRAVVLAPTVDARSGPGDEYTKIFTVHEGSKVRIRQERENWYLISLPNGLAGWVPEQIAEVI
ncbi:SH3 domain-containing protein [bacterium]|nr:SH3 domain-containing protein [bacterium]